MRLLDWLRKMIRGPKVGETFRHYIGCYVFGLTDAEHTAPLYLGAPTSHEALREELSCYLREALQVPHHWCSEDAEILQRTLDHLPQRLQAHLSTDLRSPLVQLSRQSLFVHTGVRERRQANGHFVE